MPRPLGSICSSTPSTSLTLIVQVTESTKFAQKKKQQKGAPVADDGNASAEPPRRWSDYTVFFEFPEPTELQPPLIQLNDVSFKYPGREDFGLKVSPPGKAWGTGSVKVALLHVIWSGRWQGGVWVMAGG